MTKCKYLYEFSYHCGHHLWERLDRQLSHAEYYRREAGMCPACQKEAAKDAADKRAALLSPPDKRAHWDERKRTCPVCGEAKVLVDTAKGVMCRVCRREKGMMDGKQGICDVCGRRLVLHYTGIAGRLMVCRHCWEKVTGKPAPADWAPTSEKARAAK
jgi:RNA polymerase subunit RPABC4/transcription elongation factor Spt4